MISFASPALAAAGAACVAIPVLLHLLLRRRRRPVEWAAMDLLREALRRTERRRRVERWLLLAVRTALVAAAAAAIAAPFIGSPDAGTGLPRSLVVVIDDGIASAERLDAGTALERSVRLARTRIDRLSEGDRVAVVLASRPELGAGVPASLDRRAALQRLDALESSERGADMVAAGLQREVFVHPLDGTKLIKVLKVPQNQGGHYHVWLRAMLLCPCTLGCRRSAGFLRQASVLRRAARNQDASNGWRVPRRLQVTLHEYDYQGRHASQVRPSSPHPVLQVLLPYKA